MWLFKILNLGGSAKKSDYGISQELRVLSFAIHTAAEDLANFFTI